MAVVIPMSCTRDDSASDKTKPDPVQTDTKAPTITVVVASIDITGMEAVSVSGNELHIGNILVASWTDNETRNCKVQLVFDGQTVNSGEVVKRS